MLIYASYLSLKNNYDNEHAFELIRLEEASSLEIAFTHAREQAIENVRRFMALGKYNREDTLARYSLSIRTGVGAIININDQPDSRDYKSIDELVRELPEFQEQ